AVGLLSRRRERPQRSTMERLIECDDARTALLALGEKMPAREFQGCLDCFRPGVAEKDAVHLREPRQALGEPQVRLVVKVVRNMDEPRGLLGDGADERRVRVSERRNGDAGSEIQITLAARVPNLAPLSARED